MPDRRSEKRGRSRSAGAIRRALGFAAFLPLASRAPAYARLMLALVRDDRTPPARKAAPGGGRGLPHPRPGHHPGRHADHRRARRPRGRRPRHRPVPRGRPVRRAPREARRAGHRQGGVRAGRRPGPPADAQARAPGASANCPRPRPRPAGRSATSISVRGRGPGSPGRVSPREGHPDQRRSPSSARAASSRRSPTATPRTT